MNLNKKDTEADAKENAIQEYADSLQTPISLVEFFRKAPHANLEITLRTIDDDHRRVEF